MRRLKTIVSGSLNKMQRRVNRSRRGSILVLVIALLVLLALMGTAYIATARLDRFAAQATTDLNAEAAAALQAAQAAAIKPVQQDLNPVTTPWPDIDPAVATSTFLAARAPEILTDPNTTTNPKDLHPLQPGWRYITRLKGQIYDSIYVSAANKNQAHYDFDGATSSFSNPKGTSPWQMAPTNQIITYNRAADPTISPTLDGRTYVFPAFIRWRTVAGKPQFEGPFIAGDASGAGVADSAGFKIMSTKSADYYAFIRIVDNSSAINVNTAWRQDYDLDKVTNNCFNFFRSDVDLRGMLFARAGTPNAEIDDIDSVRVKAKFISNFASEKPQIDSNANRTDFTWRNPGEAFEMQFARRLNYPQPLWGDLETNHTGRPFDASTSYGLDTGYLGWHGVMASSPPQPSSYFEQITLRGATSGPGAASLQSGPLDSSGTTYGIANSFDRAALNYVTSVNDRFTSVPANHVGLWFDWNYNGGFNPVASAVGSPVQYPVKNDASNPLGKSLDGGFFRTVKPFAVASNPVLNCPTMTPIVANAESMTASVIGTGAIALQTMPSWANAPHKTSLNTAGFGELWRAYWNVLVDPPTKSNTAEPFHVPGVDTITNPTWGPLSAYNQFSSTLRDPKNTQSDGNSGTAPNGRGRRFRIGAPASGAPRYVFDSYNMALLRSAIAAANTMHFRDSNGYVGTDKRGDYRTTSPGTDRLPSGTALTPLTLQAWSINGAAKTQVAVQVYVYGNEAQPFITEVYANSNTQKNNSKKVPKDNGKQNTSGYVAIELYNPYDTTIDLTNYAFAILNRNSTVAYAGTGFTVTGHPLDAPASNIITVAKISGQTTTLAPHTYKVLDNYNTAVGTGDASYRPALMNAAADYLHVSQLSRIFNNGTNASGELVILRPLDSTSNAKSALTSYVPVDSFDFSGLLLTKVVGAGGGPVGSVTDNRNAFGWHYTRVSGNAASSAWMCVFPGRYDSTVGTGVPRHKGTTYLSDIWDPVKNPEPWEGAAPAPAFSFGVDKATASDPAPFKSGIRLNNDLFSRATKAKAPGGVNSYVYPYGGFARVGDVTEIPFVGAYSVFLPGKLTTPLEMNSISMDVAFADDGDTANDTREQVGRFCPITDDTTTGYNDYAEYGNYLADPAALAPTVPANQSKAKYSYHFAMKLMDNFATTANPQDDYLPNIDPSAWSGTAPVAVTQTSGVTANGTTETSVPVEGLININTAPWQVLARIEWLPPAVGVAADANEKVAKAIVSYRDVDGGLKDANGDPFPHGPFKTLLELNEVFDPTVAKSAANKFRNGFGASFGKTIPVTSTPDNKWGQYSTFDPASNSSKSASIAADWANQTIMVTRVSNLLTTRSDSFTAYILVQGWRNVGTDHPELVVQKRSAILIDRSSSVPFTTNNLKTYALPAD